MRDETKCSGYACKEPVVRRYGWRCPSHPKAITTLCQLHSTQVEKYLQDGRAIWCDIDMADTVTLLEAIDLVPSGLDESYRDFLRSL